jgi:hypothetical protein
MPRCIDVSSPNTKRAFWDGESRLSKESFKLNGHAIEYARPSLFFII